jgi:eukaryotic-like serine/threonine-protein kinase
MPDTLERLKAALADRYTLQRELGRGGMATVYLAEDRKHHRPVALKVLRPELAAALGPDRFLREIDLSARLTHPHILPLHDSGNADGFLYYVMPYVEGESLRDRLTREKQLAVDDALQISREVADALSYAHSHGVIHRDIKPENILLESGHAVVADFGIARAVDVAGGDRLTETGVAMGTPAYMSPEQAGGSKDLDGRSDLYSLGCVLYEMLAGQPPFTGPTVESLVRQHLSAEPPNITNIRPSVPSWVAATLQRALAKTPADRFNPVALFAEALGQRGSTATQPMAAKPWSRKRTALVTVMAVVVVAVAVILGRSLWPFGSGTSEYPRTAIAVLPFENLSGEGPNAYFAGGLHDELLTQLAKVAALTVIGRTSVMGYAGTTKRLGDIGDELAVGSLVEGSVQVVGERLRVTVQLIDPVTEAHLWAERYDRTLDDAFAVQSDIAQQIVMAVGATLGAAEREAIAEAPTANAEAYRLYLQGEEYRRRPGDSQQNLEVAQELFERALALDSTFAIAYASLSRVHGSLYWFGFDPRPSRLQLQAHAARTAMRLGPMLPQSRWAMGMTYYWRHDYVQALDHLTAASQGLPGSAELLGTVGYAHRRIGNWAEALAILDSARTLSPRDAQLLYDLGGNTLWSLHRYQDAIRAYDRALVLTPDHWRARLNRARTYLSMTGSLDTLRQVIQRGPPAYGAEGTALLWSVRIAILERASDSVLALIPVPQAITFEAQDAYEPALLYAGWAHQTRGRPDAARRAFAGALRQLDSALVELVDDWRLHASRGLALAGLGRRDEALEEARWLLKSSVVRHDAIEGPKAMEYRAKVLSQANAANAALDAIEELLSRPSRLSVHTLRLDPLWDPIRDDPRFHALLKKYDPPQPVRY